MAKKDESKFKIKVPKIQVTKKSYDFSLSLPGMISAVGAGVLALTFFFVMGILIGRGYRPEADVPQLKEIMPTKQHGQAGEAPLEPEILKAEELDYANRVKEEPGKVMDQQPTEPKTEGAKPEATKSEAKNEEAAKATTKTVQEEQPKQEEVYKPEPAKPGEAVFDYTYQVASFRKVEMAEALGAKLSKAGLKTEIKSGEVKGNMWYRVFVLHHGTPESTAGMKAVLTKNGVGKPLLKKKSAVE